MAITREDLMRAGIGTGGMNPNVIPVQDMRITGLPAASPAQAAPMPAQAAPQRQGLLGGFFGPSGRDTRQRLALALEGMTTNPNQAFISQLQADIQGREEQKRVNATAQWLRSRGRDDLAAALEAGASPQAVMAEAIRPAETRKGVVVGPNIVDPATGEIIYEGPAPTSSDPAAFVALDLQARAAGFKPRAEGGDGSYEEFMATRGSGLAAEARAIGAARGEATAGAPADVTAAETALQYITSLRTHPGRQAGTGGSSWMGAIPGSQAREFQIEVQRLGSGAFLQAIDQLRGMGALSNAEGQTATAAIAALAVEGTEEGFLKRLKEYEDIVQKGLERARSRLQGGTQAVSAPSGVTTAPDLGLSAEDLQYLGEN